MQDELVLRYSLRIAALALLAAPLCIAFDWALSDEGTYYPIFWCFAALFAFVALRALDRRPKLRAGPEGLRYSGFGSTLFGWHEFGAFRLRQTGAVQVVEAVPAQRDAFLEKVPWWRRGLIAFLEWMGQPGIVIQIRTLDGSADELLRFLNARISHRAAAPPLESLLSSRIDAHTVRLPLATLRLPHACIACGATAERERKLVARRGWDLGVIGHAYTRVAVPVPVCAPCNRRRRAVGIGLVVAAYGALILYMFAAARLEGLTDQWRGAALVVGLGLVGLAGRQAVRLADAQVLGARIALLRGGSEVELRSSRPEWNEEAARLSAPSA